MDIGDPKTGDTVMVVHNYGKDPGVVTRGGHGMVNVRTEDGNLLIVTSVLRLVSRDGKFYPETRFKP